MEVLNTELLVLIATAALHQVMLITSATPTGNELREWLANKAVYTIHSANWDSAATVGIRNTQRTVTIVKDPS
jgi:hypothetical protein